MQKNRAEKPAEHKGKPGCPKRRKGCFPEGLWEIRGSGSPGAGACVQQCCGVQAPSAGGSSSGRGGEWDGGGSMPPQRGALCSAGLWPEGRSSASGRGKQLASEYQR